ncbi:PepSY domain-containing protein [Altererythrobacter lauratis]|uniref:PepSY domain-containing protein n=1 Tax=Alteraurantiacibacter lauratis TaxID=2054627 RepID=A0ABV7EFW5_9SPHN
MTMAGRILKRWLYLTHRWIGIAACLLFAIWFASGLAMVYFPYPSLQRSEWVAGQAAIDWQAVRISPAEAARLSGDVPPRQVTLEMRGDVPVWRVRDWGGGENLFSAVDAMPFGPASSDEARAIAARFSGMPVAALSQIENDQWTVAERYGPHRPLWKAQLDGPDDPHLYISSATGQVLLDTTRSERVWNWIGTVPHWIYFTALRENQPAWRQVVLWLSGPAILAAITGIWIGILRLRLGAKRFKGGRMTPYAGWMKWHHVAGLVGGVPLLLWIFSGWLSVDPGRYFASDGPGLPQQMTYAGSLLPAEAMDVAALAQIAPDARRVAVLSAAGKTVLRVERPEGMPIAFDGDTGAALTTARTDLPERLALLFPGAAITSTQMLTAPDAYWYRVRGELPLPVLRVKLDDDAATWLHIDPLTGEVLGSRDRKSRLYRWLFDLFHMWDVPFLLERPLLREAWLWLFSLLGLVTSISGVWIGWKRLVR